MDYNKPYYDKDNDVERIFYSDVGEKKRAGRGAFHMKGKGVKHGMRGIVFPSDYLKPKEKRLLNGEIKMSNVYDDINNVPSLEAIYEYDFEKAKKIMTVVKEKHSNTALMKHWSVKSSGTLYGHFYKFEVVQRGSRTSKKKDIDINLSKKNTDKLKTNNMVKDTELEDNVLVALNNAIEEIKLNMSNLSTMVKESQENREQTKDFKQQGFKIVINGQYEQEEITNRVMNILQTLIKEKKYNVALEINELG